MEILSKILERQRVYVTFPDLTITATEIVESECYQALQNIKRIIEDESLSDRECFQQIEEIVRVLEGLGSDGGFRHDFI